MNASINCIRFICQGLAFWGHDESRDLNNQGSFLEFLQILSNQNEAIKSVVLRNAPEILKLTELGIQKDIVSATVIKTTNVIINNLGDAKFAILIDVSIKEQMVVVLRYMVRKDV